MTDGAESAPRLRLSPVVPVMAGGICAQMLCLGMARFAYTPLLPLMEAQAGLSIRDGGILGALIYAGYMTGVLLLAVLRAPRLRFAMYRAGLVVAVLSTAATALTTDVLAWGVLRFLGGMSGAAAMLLASEFLLGWLLRHGRRPDLGWHFAGLGLGVVLSGSAAFVMAGRLAWDAQWLVLAGIGLVLLPPAWALVPRPEGAPPPRPVPAAGGAARDGAPPGRAWFVAFGLSYLAAAWGYAVCATFAVAIVAGSGGGLGQGALAWIVIGVSAALGAVAGSLVSQRVGAFATLAGAFVAQVVAVGLLLLPAQSGASLPAAALFGATFIAIVSISLTLVGLRVPENAGRVMARLTLCYGAGQVMGPAVTGVLTEAAGSYTPALLVSIAVLLAGLGCLVATRRL
ncbi:YbfB/YjiJ family MFS transporter [Oceanicella sp. SM1341]|uniref:YbfB/YjiJ family MFS transporter n=1 Tax=Oceanicella sp. SM1341 TaxID=1548889 RepID=UPI0013001C27|nr:YbfB/YjiJ family MFS transporter [Oceanicella sp. SM1341]